MSDICLDQLKDDLFGGRRWALTRPMAKRIADCALTAPDEYWKLSRKHMKERLRERTLAVYRTNYVPRYGSILVVIAIMGIVINVLVQWWLSRQTEVGKDRAWADLEQLRSRALIQLQTIDELP